MEKRLRKEFWLIGTLLFGVLAQANSSRDLEAVRLTERWSLTKYFSDCRDREKYCLQYCSTELPGCFERCMIEVGCR